MKTNHRRLAPLIVLSVSLGPACSGEAPLEEPGSTRDDAGRLLAVDAAFTERAPDLDSHTLRVDVSVTVNPSDEPALSADSVAVELVVVVSESATGVPVSDAEVGGGLLGRPIRLAHVSMQAGYTDGNVYKATFPGYARSWEVSIVRGADHLTGVVLTGPAYPVLTFSPGPASATVAWSPAAVGANVTTDVCAIPSPSQTSDWLEWCSEGSKDDGVVVLAPSNEVAGRPAVFPAPGASYQITVEESLVNLPVGSQGGTGRFQLVVGSIATDGRRCG